MEEVKGIPDLPNNIWKLIIIETDYKTVLAFCCLNKRFHKLCQQKDIWQKLVESVEKAKLVQCLNYAESHIQNPFKQFVLAICSKNPEKNVVLGTPTLMNSGLYFEPKDAYTVYTLSDSGDYPFVLIQSLQPNEQHWILQMCCGYFDSSTQKMTKEGYIEGEMIRYVGQLEQGIMQGKGKMTYFQRKSNYEGQFEDNKYQGEGTFEYIGGFIYSKNWDLSYPTEGVLYYKRMGYFEGTFKGYETQKGRYVTIIGTSFEGAINDGNYSGNIKMTDPSGFSFCTNYTNGDICDSVEQFSKKLNPCVLKCIEKGLCTRAYTKKWYFAQVIYHCLTCDLTAEKDLGICETCALLCHKNHKLVQNKYPHFGCDCHKASLCSCFELNKNYTPIFDTYLPFEEKCYFHPLLPKEYHKFK